MKTIYFVRHGESVNNATNRYNDIDTPLSERGERQVQEIAERCAKLPAEIIISSDMPRAQQTARAIAEKSGLHIETCDLFREKITSARVLGKKRDDPEAVRLIREAEQNFHVAGFRLGDGENFDDLKRRALSGLEYLAKRKEKEILVVSHGFFLWIIAAAVLFGSDLTSQECEHIIRGLGDVENTALSIVRERESMKPGSRSSWELYVWNDHAHLG